MIVFTVIMICLCLLAITVTVCLYGLISAIVDNNRLRAEWIISQEDIVRMKRKLNAANLINNKVMIRLAITDRAYINSEMNEWTSEHWNRLDMDAE